MAKTKQNKTIRASKFMVALSIFGRGNLSKWFTVALREKKKCLQCTRVHSHNNSFCDQHCCADWRAENPNQGRLNYFHDLKTGEVQLRAGGAT